MKQETKRARLALVCPVERLVLGWIEGPQGERVSKHLLSERFEVQASGLTRGEVASAQKDSAPAVCPRCKNVAVWALDGQSMTEAIAERFDPPLGTFSLPTGKRAPKGKPGKAAPLVDPALRSSPLIQDGEA